VYVRTGIMHPVCTVTVWYRYLFSRMLSQKFSYRHHQSEGGVEPHTAVLHQLQVIISPQQFVLLPSTLFYFDRTAGKDLFFHIDIEIFLYEKVWRDQFSRKNIIAARIAYPLVFIIEGPISAFPDPDPLNRLNPDPKHRLTASFLYPPWTRVQAGGPEGDD
jgi:hypothetical protein